MTPIRTPHSSVHSNVALTVIENTSTGATACTGADADVVSAAVVDNSEEYKINSPLAMETQECETAFHHVQDINLSASPLKEIEELKSK